MAPRDEWATGEGMSKSAAFPFFREEAARRGDRSGA